MPDFSLIATRLRPFRWVIHYALLLITLLFWSLWQLNELDLIRLWRAFGVSMLIPTLAVAMTIIASIGLIRLQLLDNSLIRLLIRLFRSGIGAIPQIILLLIGYTLINQWMITEPNLSHVTVMWLIALIFMLVSLPEWLDFVDNLIAVSKREGFYEPMLTLGISELRIVFKDVLWTANRAAIFNKLTLMFGSIFFLDIAMDFIFTVGLTADVQIANFPTTLGQLLASVQSKTDLFSIGRDLPQPWNWNNLVTANLFGTSVTLLIIGTIVTFYRGGRHAGQ